MENRCEFLPLGEIKEGLETIAISSNLPLTPLLHKERELKSEFIFKADVKNLVL
jgi:hypothetical protein